MIPAKNDWLSIYTSLSWCSKAATGAPGASMKLDKEDPAESVGNPVTLDFGCWFSFSESAKTRKVPLRIQFSQIFNMSTHCCLVLWVLTCVVRLWRCRRGWPIAWWSPRTWQNCWQRLGFCQQLSTRCSARLNCFFHGFFLWLCCHLCQQLVEAENLPCLSVFDGMLIYCY